MVNKDDSLDVNKIDDACYYHLIDCIKKHKKALEYVADYQLFIIFQCFLH